MELKDIARRDVGVGPARNPFNGIESTFSAESHVARQVVK
jgi:hypothetical protein